MERTTRAQQRAAAIDVSPAKLAAEIERITRERDLARRQVELAREELAKALTGAASTAATSGRGSKAPKGPSADDLAKERDEYLAALQRERAEFTNFRRRTAEEREAMLGLAA